MMRSLKKNKQPFYYATYDAEKKVYECDEGDNMKIDFVFYWKMADYKRSVIFL